MNWPEVAMEITNTVTNTAQVVALAWIAAMVSAQGRA